MKKLLLSALFIVAGAAYASEMSGILTQVVDDGGLTTYLNAPFICMRAMYTNGGLTFEFPEDFFVEEPFVYFALVYQGNINLISRYTYVAHDLSVDGVTVEVYDPLGLEINSNLVEVFLFATAPDPEGESSLISSASALIAAVPARVATPNHGHNGHGHKHGG